MADTASPIVPKFDGPVIDPGVSLIGYADQMGDRNGKRMMTDAESTKLGGVQAGAQVNSITSVAGRTGDVTVAKSDVGLGNADNTSDANKPVSTAQQAALDGKATTAQGARADSALQPGAAVSQLGETPTAKIMTAAERDQLLALFGLRVEVTGLARWSHRVVSGNGYVLANIEAATGRWQLALTDDALVPLSTIFGAGNAAEVALNSGWLLRMIANGLNLGGWKDDGTLAAGRLNVGNGLFVEVMDPAKTGYLLRLTDSVGNIRLALDRAGKLIAEHSARAIFPDGVGDVGAITQADYSSNDIVMEGDSLISELGTTGIGNGVNIVNLAVGGQAEEIVYRAGGRTFAISVAGDTIPASGSVNVTAYEIDVGFGSGYSALISIPIVVQGVACNMVGLNNGTFPNRFTGSYRLDRITPGSAVACPPSSPARSTQFDPYVGRTLILGLGRNYGIDGAQTSAIIDHHLEIIGRLTPRFPRILALDVTNGTNETPEGRSGVNEALVQALGPIVVPRRRFLTQQGVSRAIAMGLLSAPTTADNTAKASDWLPPSLASDGLHLNSTGETVLKWLINSNLRARRWAGF